MARFSSELLDRIKREVAVERLAEASGIKLKRIGKDLVGLCPFHGEGEPSLHITPETNLFHCFGCGAAGSSIDWVMKMNGVSFRHAVELLREDTTLVASGPLRPLVRSTVRRLPAPVDFDAGDQDLLRQVVRFYHDTLKQSPEALAYLESRGLGSAEMIDRFQLGFSNRTLGYRLPEKNRQAGEELRGRLQKLGFLRESGHEHFAGSIVVPILDEQGNVTEIYGRKVNDNLRKGTPLHLYLPGPHRGVWNVEALAAAKEIILCEALLDALTFWRHGLRNVTSSYGAGGLTDDHLAAFARYGIETVLIAYDRDDAGERGAEAALEKLAGLGITCYRVRFPHGLDANEYARKVEPAPKALALLLASAAWVGGPARDRAPVFSSLLVAAAKRNDGEETRRTEEEDAEVSAGAETSDAPEETSGGSDSPEDAGLPEAKTRPESAAADPIALPEPVALTPATLAVEAKEKELVVRIEDRSYRVRGLPEALGFERLNANVLVTREMETVPGSGLASGFHVERFDLYARPQRTAFAREAARELRVREDLVKRDLGRLLLLVEEYLEERKKKRALPEVVKPEMAEQDRESAQELLRAPDLLDRILKDFARCGVVGEETNKLMGYLAVVSRKLEEPLALIVQSSSAAGKSSLMEAVLAFVPPEDRIKYSAMTGQSLFYLGETDLKHRVLAIVEEEGAEKASYALKLLQSEGELTIASTGKDPETGKLVTQDYHVEGPVMLFLTTTAAEIDEELLNRCIVLTVNEDREQTRAIHELQRQRQTLEGRLATHERERVWELHRNAQRLLEPLLVTNPFARELTFLDTRTRMRRDHLKYLTLIRVIALLHQHQREKRTVVHDGKTFEYIEATRADIGIANRLAAEVLGRSLDELAPQTRRLLLLLEAMVKERCEKAQVDRRAVRFSRRDVRDWTSWSAQQLQVHLNRLVALEYVLAHHGGRGLSYAYELIYNGEGLEARPFLLGLAAVEDLGATGTTVESTASEPESTGAEGGINGSSTAHLAPILGPSTVSGNGSSPHPDATIADSPTASPENARHRRFSLAPRRHS